ncbi:MAG: metallophosphoesterase [Spirochaetaceae bacterium]|jgi:predicted MPP superfamily phosphohydrolase|nr:metallophosphoesterase [Spirochaetaceae bacterium]
MRKRDRLNQASTFQKKGNYRGDYMFVVVVLLYILYLISFIFIANRFIYALKLSSPAKYFCYVTSVVLSVVSILAFIGRRNDHDFFTFISPLSFVLMGAWAITISFAVLNEVINLAVIPFKIKNFRYYSTLITACVCAAASLWSIINCAFIQRIKEVSISVPSLSVPEFKIVQLSDIHIGAGTNIASIKKTFETASAQNPDIIVFTGDIIDTDILKNDAYLNYGFNSLKARYGIFAVTGNHDHYTGVEIFYELMRRCGITVLRDDSIVLENIINISGINDVSFRSEEMITIALSDIDKNYPVLFLSHRPEAFDFAAKTAANLVQLSGHTHGGQIPPIEIARRFFMKYNLGVYQSNDSVMFVSSGVRWWGPPMRFGNFCEISVINLLGGKN